jgi:hypothetical protein
MGFMGFLHIVYTVGMEEARGGMNNNKTTIIVPLIK